MAAKYRMPDFKKMYPEASDQVIQVLRTSERKMIYLEYDLKVDRKVKQQDGQIKCIPSKEDSYERLAELNVQFAEMTEGPEEQVLRAIEVEQLNNALSRLTKDENALIDLLFYQMKTEREVADLYHLSQSAVNKRRKKVLEKLRKLLENT